MKFSLEPLARAFGLSKSQSSGRGMSGPPPPASWPWQWWQQGWNKPEYSGPTAAAQACVDAYAQTLASMRVEVEKINENKSREPIYNVAAARVLRKPNSYQTSSDFELNLIKGLMLHGNAYAYATRNNRNEVDSLHLLSPTATQPYVETDSGTIFYATSSNPMRPDLDYLIPQRDVMHIKLYCPRHPLVGVSPIENAAMAIATNSAISQHQANFFSNMSRPSGVLSTDQKLTRDQLVQLRAAWEEQSKSMASGGVPILTSGITWEQMAMSSQDAEMVSAFNMSVTDIARAFRIPLPLVNLYENATYNNVEQLYAQWLSGGLGFLLEHVERAFEDFFEMDTLKQRISFDTDTLLRTDFNGRVEGFSRLVQSGIMTVNEARMKAEGLPPVEHGDQPIVQAQMVPLGWNEEMAADEPPVADPSPADPNDPNDPVPDEDEQRGAKIYYLKQALNG